MGALVSPSQGTELEPVEGVEQPSAFRLNKLDMMSDVLRRLHLVVIW